MYVLRCMRKVLFRSMSHIHLLRCSEAVVQITHTENINPPGGCVPSISFAGGGNLWPFAIGVGHFVKNHYDVSKIRYLTASSGCFTAVPMACGLDPYEWCARDWCKCVKHFESRGVLGCMFDSKMFYYRLWNDYLPEDAHVRVTGRLFISVTLVPLLQNLVVSVFHTRADLIWTIVASMCLPVVFMRDGPIKLLDGFAIDGSLTNDMPCMDAYTVTVSALRECADVCCVNDLNDDQVSVIDTLVMPVYDRVWEIALLGESAAAQCTVFQREDWSSIRIKRSAEVRDYADKEHLA